MRDIAESIGLARGQYRIVKNTLIDNNISIRSIGAMTGTLNSSWKGDEAGQVALHRWLRVHHQKKEICSKCGKQGYTEYANIKGHNYTRNIEDYMEMCKPCHTEYDSN